MLPTTFRARSIETIDTQFLTTTGRLTKPGMATKSVKISTQLHSQAGAASGGYAGNAAALRTFSGDK